MNSDAKVAVQTHRPSAHLLGFPTAAMLETPILSSAPRKLRGRNPVLQKDTHKKKKAHGAKWLFIVVAYRYLNGRRLRSIGDRACNHIGVLSQSLASYTPKENPPWQKTNEESISGTGHPAQYSLAYAFGRKRKQYWSRKIGNVAHE